MGLREKRMDSGQPDLGVTFSCATNSCVTPKARGCPQPCDTGTMPTRGVATRVK